MQRFLNALVLAEPGVESPGLRTVAQALVEAIEEAEAEGQRAEEDPAVLAIGAFVAFHTHSDVNSVRGFNHLLELSRNRLSDGVVA